MSLLREIQADLLQEDKNISSIFLKLRLLSAKIESVGLEEWVKFESEGYPHEIDLPPYRLIGVTYTATFMGPMGSNITNAQVPLYLVKKHAGNQWVEYNLRMSISAIDSLISSSTGGRGSLVIDAANLILVLQGKMYPGYNCVSVNGSISSSALIEVRHAVKSRIMDLTLELEKQVPSSAEISLQNNYKIKEKEIEMVARITNQVIHGNVTNINSYGNNSSVNVNIDYSAKDSIIENLISSGVSPEDAEDFLNILTSEKPSSNKEPFGERAQKWVVDNIKKAADGTWSIGVSAATNLLTEVALKYYGLK